MFFPSSEATIVKSGPPTTLIFTKSNVLNTTLLLNNSPYFKVTTLDTTGARTTVTDSRTKELLVTMQKKTFLADTITFAHKYDGISRKQKDWLVQGKTADGVPKWTINTAAGNFVWKNDAVYRLTLSPENDPNHRVAYTQSPTMADHSIPFALLVDRDMEYFLDEIVASFLILEQKLRREERAMEIYLTKLESGGGQYASLTSTGGFSF